MKENGQESRAQLPRLGSIGRRLVVLLVATSSSVFTATPDDGRLAGIDTEAGRLTVRVYNYARISPARLARAEAVAGRILRKAGIETAWLDCALSKEEAARKPACEAPFGPTDLVLKIVPEAEVARLNFRPITFGVALLSEEGGEGTTAYLFYDRVEALAAAGVCPAHVVLGHTFAHEIGHLLLRTTRHAHAGILRANWKEEELRLAARGMLSFSSDEAARLRAELLARNRQLSSVVLPRR